MLFVACSLPLERHKSFLVVGRRILWAWRWFVDVFVEAGVFFGRCLLSVVVGGNRRMAVVGLGWETVVGLWEGGREGTKYVTFRVLCRGGMWVLGRGISRE